MGVPMSGFAWVAAALETNPSTVRRVHEQYIEAGADIITTNTYASARHNLEPIGLVEKVTELNLRAVALAQEARDKAAKDRPVLVAGSVSNFGLRVASEGDYERRRGTALGPRRCRGSGARSFTPAPGRCWSRTGRSIRNRPRS